MSVVPQPCSKFCIFSCSTQDVTRRFLLWHPSCILTVKCRDTTHNRGSAAALTIHKWRAQHCKHFSLCSQGQRYTSVQKVIVTRQFLPVIYQAGVKALFHRLCRLSRLNLELLAVISSRECAVAAAAPDYFCLCSGFYAFCFTHWQGLLLILKKGWLVRCPTPPSPCGLAQQDSDLCDEPFTPPPDLSKSFSSIENTPFCWPRRGFLYGQGMWTISRTEVSGACMELSLLSIDMVDNVLDICPDFLPLALKAAFVLECS